MIMCVCVCVCVCVCEGEGERREQKGGESLAYSRHLGLRKNLGPALVVTIEH